MSKSGDNKFAINSQNSEAGTDGSSAAAQSVPSISLPKGGGARGKCVYAGGLGGSAWNSTHIGGDRSEYFQNPAIVIGKGAIMIARSL